MITLSEDERPEWAQDFSDEDWARYKAETAAMDEQAARAAAAEREAEAAQTRKGRADWGDERMNDFTYSEEELEKVLAEEPVEEASLGDVETSGPSHTPGDKKSADGIEYA